MINDIEILNYLIANILDSNQVTLLAQLFIRAGVVIRYNHCVCQAFDAFCVKFLLITKHNRELLK